MWARVVQLSNNIGGVTSQPTITLATETVRFALGLHLLQSAIVALVISISSKSFSPWIIPMSTLLQIGWIWNRVTESWRVTNATNPLRPQRRNEEELYATAASWPSTDVPPVGGVATSV